jgi:hypothetical protein
MYGILTVVSTDLKSVRITGTVFMFFDDAQPAIIKTGRIINIDKRFIISP